MYRFKQEMGGATFWAIFSKTHLVTLVLIQKGLLWAHSLMGSGLMVVAGCGTDVSGPSITADGGGPTFGGGVAVTTTPVWAAGGTGAATTAAGSPR
jgi:hypothetical protein